jgi:hypothetical protein
MTPCRAFALMPFRLPDWVPTEHPRCRGTWLLVAAGQLVQRRPDDRHDLALRAALLCTFAGLWIVTDFHDPVAEEKSRRRAPLDYRRHRPRFHWQQLHSKIIVLACPQDDRSPSEVYVPWLVGILPLSLTHLVANYINPPCHLASS